ncbi:hypothetical protein [Flavobacterium sp. DSR3-2]|uniref:hypothetical protein n=1 Tax=Flavobacterium sp. DSR3-2 TaxID=2804634 RepID=UPI003CF9C4DC
MKKILWSQNENPTVPNTIIDTEGKIIKIGDLRGGSFELFDELLDYQKLCIDVFIENNLVIKRNVQKGVVPKTVGYFISSVFENKDDVGRLIPFMFYIESKDTEEIIKVLRAFSSKISRTLFVSDLENIKLHINRNRIKKKVKTIIGIIFIIITLYILWIKNC